MCYTWATWFGSGYSPVAPGTAGSLAALPFVWFFARLGFFPLAAFAVVTFITGVAVSQYISTDSSADDPQIVVIDEVCGMSISMLMIPSGYLDISSLWSWMIVLASFGFFRLFDVWKPWPASYFDGSVHNGWGMMLDDVAAGVYAMICTFFLYKLFLFVL
ncbi:MAG TPA: phosphatidylglycerophosphatase A [bacterium]|nr:phosphatidylglycerophosphatase A [bacterium]